MFEACEFVVGDVEHIAWAKRCERRVMARPASGRSIKSFSGILVHPMLDTNLSPAESTALESIEIPAAWEASTLREDKSWIIQLTDPHRAELMAALDHFKETMHARGLTAQWLHGNMTPQPADFPLPTLARLLGHVRTALEVKYGLVLLKGFPVSHVSHKDLHLLHAGMASHVGTLRPQTVFGELVQDLSDSGQAALEQRRGSKHNRALPFHNDPCDVVSFSCIEPALTGGTSLFCSSVAIHNAMLRSVPVLAETLYHDFVHAYQDYLFVKTGSNQRFLPSERYYFMPIFTIEQGSFACKYSRFYIDQAQKFPELPRLTRQQVAALEAFENELRNERWQLRMPYEPGDVTFINNFVCFHARTAFTDDATNEHRRRHLLRIWLSMPNSRPLSSKWRHLFFQRTEAGAIRGGVPVPEISYA